MAASLVPSLVLLLEGDLGAGKTTLVQAICRHLGWIGAKSPTFALVNEYPDAKIPVAHADLYRLEKADSADFGFDDYIDNGWVLMIEWPDRLTFEDFPDLWHCRLSIEGEGRRITIESRGMVALAALESLKEHCRGK